MAIAEGTLCIVTFTLLLAVLFYQQCRYKSEKTNWKTFFFFFVVIGLQISAFFMLPFDIMQSWERRGQALSEKKSEYRDKAVISASIIKVYWWCFYLVNFICNL